MLKRLSQNGYSIKQNSILGDVFNYADKTKTSITNLSTMFGDDSDNAKKQRMEEMSKYILFLYISELLPNLYID